MQYSLHDCTENPSSLLEECTVHIWTIPCLSFKDKEGSKPERGPANVSVVPHRTPSIIHPQSRSGAQIRWTLSRRSHIGPSRPQNGRCADLDTSHLTHIHSRAHTHAQTNTPNLHEENITRCHTCSTRATHTHTHITHAKAEKVNVISSSSIMTLSTTDLHTMLVLASK